MKNFWDERYDEDGFVYSEAPNVYLTEITSEVPTNGSVLVVGDGEGRNDLSTMDITVLEEKVVHLDKGKYHCGDGAVVRMVAQKV